MTPQQANELLPQALTAMRDLDAISMALGARLAQIDTRSVGGHDYLLRDAVMREVMEWRRAWDKNSADRPDFAAWNRRAPAPTEPAVDRDAVPLSPGRVMAITDAIIPGDDWDGNDWDHAVANRAFMAGFAERGRIMREINSMVESFDVATPASPAVPGKPRFKDHDIRQLVNDLRAIAIEFHAAGQLRERISAAVQQFLAGPQVAQASQPTSAEGKDSERLDVNSQITILPTNESTK